MITRNFLNSLDRARQDFAESNLLLASGKKLNRPSDGPADNARLVRIRDDMSRINQYYRNIGEARVAILATDDALNGLRNLTTKISERGVYGLNITLDQAGRDAVAAELEGLREEILQISSTMIDGKFIFSGTAVTTEPIAAGGGTYTYQGSSDPRVVEISANDKLEVTVTGDGVFTNSAGDLLGSLTNMIDQLRAGDLDGLRQSLQDVQDASKVIDLARIRVGTGLNRLDEAKSRHDAALLRLTEQVMNLEDVDITEAVMRVQQAETALQAALTAGSRLKQPTLFDYIG
jgi:flagellar hook-associated protein 3 FlgL